MHRNIFALLVFLPISISTSENIPISNVDGIEPTSIPSGDLLLNTPRTPNLTQNLTSVTSISSDPHTLQMDLKICSKTDPTLSKYCNCGELVVSCDFSQFPQPNPETKMNKTDLHVYVDLVDFSVKRLCICSSPSHLRLNVTRSSHLLSNKSDVLSNLHRLDIYSLGGPLILSGAFKFPFSGDVYMQNLTIHDLQQGEFYRGSDIPIEDVQHLECCSKIQVPQHYKKPLLYISSMKIGTIHSGGLDSYHLWNTVILKHLIVTNGIRTRGINFASSEKVNVSITNCDFSNVTHEGITIRNFHNLLMAKTYLDAKSDPLALQITSNVPNSSLVLVDNYFDNMLMWRMDAQKVVNWFNMYDFWDNWTFSHLNETAFPLTGRVFSVEYNTIGHFNFTKEANFDSLSNTNVIFNENVLGICNCSYYQDGFKIPDLISEHPQRCDPMTHLVPISPKQSCLLDLKAVIRKCAQPKPTEDFSSMCPDQGVPMPSFRPEKFKTVTFKATGVFIVSPFLAYLIQDLNFTFHIHHVFSHSEEVEESQYTNDNNNVTISSSHSVLLTIVILFTVTFIVATAYFLIKRRRFISRVVSRNTFSDDYDVLTTPT